MKKIKVLVADDHTIVRQGLCRLLSMEQDIEVIGEAGTGRQAVQLAKTLKPDVVLMDIAMPVLSGLEATRQITRQTPSARVLILSSYGEDEYVDQLTEAGGAGYLLKQADSADVIRAIREAKEGNAFFSPAICRRLSDRYRETIVGGVPAKKRSDRLTSREVEVLQLIGEGGGNKQIAAELGVSVKTVERHRQKLKNKLAIHDVAGLTRYAIANGLIEANTVGAETEPPRL